MLTSRWPWPVRLSQNFSPTARYDGERGERYDDLDEVLSRLSWSAGEQTEMLQIADDQNKLMAITDGTERGTTERRT
mgnify:CR=1 FL=1